MAVRGPQGSPAVFHFSAALPCTFSTSTNLATPAPRDPKHLILAGAGLFEGKWRSIRNDIESLLEKFFPNAADRPRELHASEARKGRGPYSRLSKDDRDRLLGDACAILSNLRDKEITLFGIVIDKAWWFSRNPGKTGDELYLDAFEDLVSRFDYYLRRRHQEGQPAKGLIIADPKHQSFCGALKSALRRFHADGTQWARLQNVIETVLFLESHESPGVQLADLTSYALWRAAEASDLSLATKIRYCFDRESFDSSFNPGKWHGVRFQGPSASPVRANMTSLWPTG